MSKTDAIIVPREVWDTVFACFAGHVGSAMQFHGTMPEIWADAFRFACDDDALDRLGIPRHTPSQTPSSKVAV